MQSNKVTSSVSNVHASYSSWAINFLEDLKQVFFFSIILSLSIYLKKEE